MKRSSLDTALVHGAKRAHRAVEPGSRLCDLPAAYDLFIDPLNASRAKDKGMLRWRPAEKLYVELEAKLLELHKETDGIDELDEDWLLQVLPELKSLEPETLDAIILQSRRHSLYELAARQLVERERARMEEVMEDELDRLRLEQVRAPRPRPSARPRCPCAATAPRVSRPGAGGALTSDAPARRARRRRRRRAVRWAPRCG